jgi:hypothetical protein
MKPFKVKPRSSPQRQILGALFLSALQMILSLELALNAQQKPKLDSIASFRIWELQLTSLK